MAMGTVHFIIVAAGGGSRFGGDIPKQFRLLAGKAVVCHSIDTFTSFCLARGIRFTITVVLSGSGRPYWAKISADSYSAVKIVPGGASRAHSVYNAVLSLEGAEAGDYVLIHDAARPLVSESIIDELLSACNAGAEAVVPVIAPTDSLMAVETATAAIPVPRSHYRAVQTPQAFEYSCLAEAYDIMKDSLAAMTDDASVVYAAVGRPIKTVPGDPCNMKITHSSDLIIAEQLIAR